MLERVCGICFCPTGDVDNPRGRINSCTHLFCVPCLEEWAKATNICPQCRQRFSRIEAVIYRPMTENADVAAGTTPRMRGGAEDMDAMPRDRPAVDTNAASRPGKAKTATSRIASSARVAPDPYLGDGESLIETGEIIKVRKKNQRFEYWDTDDEAEEQAVTQTLVPVCLVCGLSERMSEMLLCNARRCHHASHIGCLSSKAFNYWSSQRPSSTPESDADFERSWRSPGGPPSASAQATAASAFSPSSPNAASVIDLPMWYCGTCLSARGVDVETMVSQSEELFPDTFGTSQDAAPDSTTGAGEPPMTADRFPAVGGHSGTVETEVPQRRGGSGVARPPVASRGGRSGADYVGASGTADDWRQAAGADEMGRGAEAPATGAVALRPDWNVEPESVLARQTTTSLDAFRAKKAASQRTLELKRKAAAPKMDVPSPSRAWQPEGQHVVTAAGPSSSSRFLVGRHGNPSSLGGVKSAVTMSTSAARPVGYYDGPNANALTESVLGLPSPRLQSNTEQRHRQQPQTPRRVLTAADIELECRRRYTEAYQQRMATLRANDGILMANAILHADDDPLRPGTVATPSQLGSPSLFTSSASPTIISRIRPPVNRQVIVSGDAKVSDRLAIVQHHERVSESEAAAQRVVQRYRERVAADQARRTALRQQRVDAERTAAVLKLDGLLQAIRSKAAAAAANRHVAT